MLLSLLLYSTFVLSGTASHQTSMELSDVAIAWTCWGARMMLRSVRKETWEEDESCTCDHYIIFAFFFLGMPASLVFILNGNHQNTFVKSV